VPDNTELLIPSESQLSFNVLKGLARIGTVRFKGFINGLPIQILLDNGSSNNFLQPRIAACLKLSVEHIQNFKCWLGMAILWWLRALSRD